MRKMIVAAVAAPLALAMFAPAMADGHKAMATVEYPINFLDQDDDSEIPLRVIFKLENEGWRSWVGTYKPEVEGSHRAVAVTIAILTEVITDP